MTVRFYGPPCKSKGVFEGEVFVLFSDMSRMKQEALKSASGDASRSLSYQFDIKVKNKNIRRLEGARTQNVKQQDL